MNVEEDLEPVLRRNTRGGSVALGRKKSLLPSAILAAPTHDSWKLPQPKSR